VGIRSDGIDSILVQFHRYYNPKYTELGYPMISESTVRQSTLFNNNAGASSVTDYRGSHHLMTHHLFLATVGEACHVG
jgi:hypothetical protein